MCDIRCAHKFCIYWKDWTCAKDFVWLDESGVCKCYMRIYLTDEFLEEQRKKTDSLLDELE